MSLRADAMDGIDLPERFGFRQQGDFFRSAEWFRCLHATAVTHPPRVYNAGDSAMVCCWNGRTLESLANYYTVEFGVLGDGQVDAIVERIAADRPSGVRLTFLPEALVDALTPALRSAGFFVRPYFMYENWFVRLNGRDFLRYLAGRPSQTTNTIKRRRKKLAAAHAHEIVLTREADRIRDFVTVYESSWKHAEPHPAFIPTLAATCAALGVLRLGILYVDGAPAAAQLWITTAKKALIYKLAYDERFRDYSVGSILSLEMFRQAIDEDRVEEIDYGVGSEPYKRDWMEDKRRLYGLAAFNLRTPLGLFRAGVERAKLALRRASPGRGAQPDERDATSMNAS
jgi:GNAT acetyltransferase-like protein